ncbi:hypothetical protein GOB94_07430 [Granulicella sp. 5B5]|uniref:hypothetical protein n=1 Tax=Granulicella sp. 5B5 TaxID=1617967 RepID=UPI0015F48A10|nr:hypothetical protein [Granulicella sp. 5B5]QMV18535.1 hypothetical protein GOB94_07430 [Granulicella sp. 5B5]
MAAQDLPDAPSTVLFAGAQQPQTPSNNRQSNPAQAAADQAASASTRLPPCNRINWGWRIHNGPKVSGPCQEDPLQLIVNPGDVTPLTPTDKLVLAGRVTVDPFNLITVTGYSAIFVAANAHSAYGPGLKGFGKLTGYSLLGDAQGNFLGIYAIPVLAHEDPRYHRMPGSPVHRRILHALVHTVVSQHDDGSLMPNYATLLTYPISAELSNLYVPGIGSNGPSTAKRILLGYATDPSGALIAEFLPDVAKRIHIHVVFVQQILLQVENNSRAQ